MVPVVGERKGVIIAVVFSLFLLGSMSGVVFASSDNWVEVMTINRSGSASINSGLFTIDYSEWRIRWQFEPGEHWHFPQLTFLNISIYEEGELDNYFANIYGSGNQNNGTYYIADKIGEFYMKINTGMIDDFSVIIEQNIESIPEFPLDSNSLFEEKTYHVHNTHDFYVVKICSNSTVSDFCFHYALMRISFYVNGTIGTTGLCNVTIPSEFMSTEFSIFKDEKPLIKNSDYTETFNGTHYLFTITYQHSTHLIEVFANNNIPEFPSWTILPMFLIVTLMVTIYRRRNKNNEI